MRPRTVNKDQRELGGNSFAFGTTGMAHLLEIAIGVVLAGTLVVVLRRAPFARVLRFWAWGLFVAAAIYVGLALFGGASAQWFLIEAGGLILFAALAVVGAKYSPSVLAGAWLAHIGWDHLLHSENTAFVPLWYPTLCIGFDVVVGVYLIVAYNLLYKPAVSNSGAAEMLAPMRHRS